MSHGTGPSQGPVLASVIPALWPLWASHHQPAAPSWFKCLLVLIHNSGSYPHPPSAKVAAALQGFLLLCPENDGPATPAAQGTSRTLQAQGSEAYLARWPHWLGQALSEHGTWSASTHPGRLQLPWEAWSQAQGGETSGPNLRLPSASPA